MSQVHTEALQWALDVLFTGEQTVPVNFYVRLATDTTIAKTATLASITEVSGSGYAAQAVPFGPYDSGDSGSAGWIIAAVGSNDRKATSYTVTFNATGDWTTANSWYLATTSDNTGKLLCSARLTDENDVVQSITLHAGQSRDQAVEIRFNS